MRWLFGLALLLLIGGYNTMRRNDAQLVMARTMYGEARGEGSRGMQAVGNVILNRATLGGWWGDDVISVALKPWQFSAWNANDPNRDVIEALQPGDNDVFDEAYRIAGELLAGNLPDITGGATHYHTTAIEPNWADGATVTASIGNHVFYAGVA